jgi:hypothetical protein
MKPAIGYVEYPTRRSGMRNSQRSRPTNVLIINQRPSIETVSDRDKAIASRLASFPKFLGGDLQPP